MRRFERGRRIERWPPEWEPRSEPGEVYQLGPHALLCGDCFGSDAERLVQHQLAGQVDQATLVFDPPWDGLCGFDKFKLRGWHRHQRWQVLVFADARRLGEATELWGPPTWQFVWDTGSPWSSGPNRPLQQHKLALWYGDLQGYRRDAGDGGPAAPGRDHPSTRQAPGEARRLTDVWRQSLRWLLTGAPHPHMKPTEWVRAMLACTQPEGRVVLDPFAGSGTSLLAAEQLGRLAVLVEVDRHACDVIRARWGALRGLRGDDALDPAALGIDPRVGPSQGHQFRLKAGGTVEQGGLFAR